MASAALKMPTFDDLYAEIEAMAPGLTAEILEPGEIRTMSRPGGKHSYSTQRILRALRGHNLIDGGLGWWLEIEREIRFAERLYVPDLSGWRVDAPPTFVDDNPILVPPDWACEILSRTTQRGDRAVKLPRYAVEGVAHVWVVDPTAETIEVYETVTGRPLLVASARGHQTLVLPPFDGPIDVGTLWKAPPPEAR